MCLVSKPIRFQVRGAEVWKARDSSKNLFTLVWIMFLLTPQERVWGVRATVLCFPLLCPGLLSYHWDSVTLDWPSVPDCQVTPAGATGAFWCPLRVCIPHGLVRICCKPSVFSHLLTLSQIPPWSWVTGFCTVCSHLHLPH